MMNRTIEDMTFKEINLVLSNPCIPNGDKTLDEEKYIIMLLKMDIVSELIEEIVIAGSLYDRKDYSILKIANKSNQYLTELRDYLNDIEYLPKGEIK